MIERMEAYFEKLEKATAEQLDRSAQAISVKEKKNTALLIAHIAEIAKRNYHLELGYKSIFEYCLKRLNLSEGSVYRRTQVAGVCRRFPQLLEALRAGRLNLTAASLIAPHLTEENAEDLIRRAAGKTKRELEEVLASVAPKKPFSPSVRKRPLPNAKPLKEALRSKVSSECKSSEEDASPAPGATHVPDLFEPATEDRYNFRFSAGKPKKKNSSICNAHAKAGATTPGRNRAGGLAGRSIPKPR